jgi:hypothetical protein
MATNDGRQPIQQTKSAGKRKGKGIQKQTHFPRIMSEPLHWLSIRRSNTHEFGYAVRIEAWGSWDDWAQGWPLRTGRGVAGIPHVMGTHEFKWRVVYGDGTVRWFLDPTRRVQWNQGWNANNLLTLQHQPRVSLPYLQQVVCSTVHDVTRNGASPHQELFGKPLLWHACSLGDEPSVLALLAAGADPNRPVKSERGWTPLAALCMQDCVSDKCMQAMADAGANFGIKFYFHMYSRHVPLLQFVVDFSYNGASTSPHLVWLLNNTSLPADILRRPYHDNSANHRFVAAVAAQRQQRWTQLRSAWVAACAAARK